MYWTDRQTLYWLRISVISSSLALINMYQEHSMFVKLQSRSVPQPSSTNVRSKHRRSPGTCQHLKVNIASHMCLGLRAIFVCPPVGSTEDPFVEGREFSWSQFNHRLCQCNWWPWRHGGVAADAVCDRRRAVSPVLAS